MQVTERPTESLIPYARNARTHSEAQIDQIAASIVEFGWTNPILVDGERGIIAGHGRLLAARKLNRATVPCIELDGMTDAQKRAYVLADNKLALNAGWNDDLLRLELQDLESMGADLSLIGFDEAELEAISFERRNGTTDANAEWQGMPEFFQPDKTAFRSIMMHFKSQEDVDAFAKLIGQSFSDKAKYLWHPAQERVEHADKEYVSV